LVDARQLRWRGKELTWCFTARSRARADATVAIIKAAAPSTRINVHYGEFSNLTSVAALGREIVSRHSRIDALINNAGIHAFKSRVTADGYARWLRSTTSHRALDESSARDVDPIGAVARRHCASQASRQAAGFDPWTRSSTNDPSAPVALGDLRPDEIDEHHVFDGVWRGDSRTRVSPRTVYVPDST